MKPGPRNLITDVAGLRVGNAEDHHIKTGTTVLVGDKPFRASVDVMGGSPGTRETDLLSPERLVDGVDALVLSGGSAYGLDAASGVSDALRAMGRGFVYVDLTIPIVPAAILFDLAHGGDKNWNTNPYRELGARALAAAGEDFALGTVGAGVGATSAGLKGGLGSASLVLDSGHTVGAVVGANPTGAVTSADGHFWAAPWEIDGEFGGLGVYPHPIPFAQSSRTKKDALAEIANTTIAIVATDADLSKTQLKRLAVAAQDGMARAISPAHTLVDGDLIFSVSTGARPLKDPIFDAITLGHAAAVCLARAIARAVYHATPVADDVFPTWQQKWGKRR
jgi:L-aminopeptidase/D-esterase-like protein